MPVISTIAAATARAFGAFKAAAGGAADEFFNYVTLLLHGDGTNGAQNNTFLDSSTNNFTITRNGNTTQGTFSPFSQDDGKWANFLNGGYSYLTNSTGLGSNNFTIEFWGLDISGSSNYGIFSIGGTAGADFAGVTMASGGGLYISTTGSSWTYSNVGGLTLSTDGQWHHYAIVRNGGSLLTFKDGALIATVSISGTIVNNSGQWRFGAKSDQSGSTTGYISNFRVVNGTAVYTSAFTVPSTPLTAITNTAVLVCQGNRFKDSSANAFAVTVSGSPSIQPFSPFAPSAAYDSAVNGGSGYFDGSADYLSIANDTDFDMGSGDFTIEGWFYQTSSSGLQTICGKYETNYQSSWTVTTNGTSWFVYTYYSTTSDLLVYTGAAPALNQWNHFALERNGANIEFYVNGSRLAQVGAQTMRTTTSGVSIGRLGSGYTNYFYGYISNLRIIKGTAVYSGATYTVPTAPLTAITNTSLLCNFTNAGILDNTGRNDLETVGNAQISTSVKKFGTGSIYLDGTGDAIYASSNENLKFLTGDFTFEFWIYFNAVNNSTVKFLFDFRNAGATTSSFLAQESNNSWTYWNGAGSTLSTGWSSGTFTTGTWYHIAICRSSGTTKFFVNGTSTSSVSDTSSYANGTFTLGARYSISEALNGYIDDLRITKGVARYTSNFTPPTAAFEDQ